MRAKDVRAQVRSGFGDSGANYFRRLYGWPRAPAHPALLRRADRLTARTALAGGASISEVSTYLDVRRLVIDPRRPRTRRRGFSA
jgi:hypothetical protein